MKWVLSVFFILATLTAGAAPLPHGYVTDTRSERDERFYEIFLFAEPPPSQKPLSDVIFNVELSREFKERYRSEFGAVDTESLNYQHNDTNRFDAFDNNRGYSAEVIQQSDKRRSFANYMMKRLMEWHIDNYIKSEPSMRPVYELKEKMKKVEVKVTKETKLEMRYSLAGNIIELMIENPYADSILEIDMDPGTVGPSEVQDQKFISRRPLTRTLTFQNTVFDRDGRERMELIKTHTSMFSTLYGIDTAYKSGDSPRDSRLIAGLSYSF